MILRLTIMISVVLVVAPFCAAQRPVVGLYGPSFGATASIAMPGMFGPRVLGRSLVPGDRTFAVIRPTFVPAPIVPLGYGPIAATPWNTPAVGMAAPAAAPNAPVAGGAAERPQFGPGTIPIPNTRPTTNEGAARRARPRPAPRSAGASAAIDYLLPAAGVVQAQLSKSLQNLVGRQGSPPIEAVLHGHIVLLRGSAPTAHARDLATRLALLEPGIEQVHNELTIP